MQRGVIAVLDIGTSKVACLVLRFVGPDEPARPRRRARSLSQGAFRVIGAANTRSRGVAFGEIAAMEETRARDPHRDPGRAEDGERAGRPRDRLLLGRAAALLRAAPARPRSQDGAVAERDIGHVLAACDDPRLRPGPRGAARAAGELLRSTTASGLTDPRGQIGNGPGVRHAPADGRRRRRSGTCCTASSAATWNSPGMASRPTPAASRASSRTSRSSAPPASTWAAGRPASRSSCGGT